MTEAQIGAGRGEAYVTKGPHCCKPSICMTRVDSTQTTTALFSSVNAKVFSDGHFSHWHRSIDNVFKLLVSLFTQIRSGEILLLYPAISTSISLVRGSY